MKKHIPTVLAVMAVLAICIIAVGAVTLGEDGTLRTLVRTDTDAGAWQDNADKAMDSETAAELALEKAGVSAGGANVTAWKEAKNGDILWQVEIADVDAGSGLTVTYFVTLNALTGEVTMLDMTRFFSEAN